MNLLALLWLMAENLFIKPLQHYRPQSINLLKIQTRQLNLIRVTVIFPTQAQQVIKYYFTALIKFHWIWCKCNARDHHRGHYGKYVCFNLHWLRIYVVLESLYWIANEKIYTEWPNICDNSTYKWTDLAISDALTTNSSAYRNAIIFIPVR